MPDVLALVGPTGVQLLVFFCFSSSAIPSCRVLIVVLILYSFDFLCSRRCFTDDLGTLHADELMFSVYHGITKGKDCGHVKSI